MNTKVLVVEDQEDNRRIVRDLLGSVGIEVVEAMTGAQGVEMAADVIPALIIMDVQLPEMDGLEATRRLKSHPELKHIPIIVLTSFALKGDDNAAYEAGCDVYLPKPVSPRELLVKVKELMLESEET